MLQAKLTEALKQVEDSAAEVSTLKDESASLEERHK